MRFDFFWYPETNRRPWSVQVSRPASVVSVDLPGSTSLPDALKAAQAAGMSKGSDRGGCFEVQNDLGLWVHRDPAKRARGWGRLTPENAEFVQWSDLD